MHRSVALRTAVDRTLDRTSVSTDELVGFDLYSCFPAAVQIALDAFGVDPSDPRPFTQTGGLPYFGGPGASYSLHGVACTVERVRAGDGAVGAVVGVGGGCNDFAVGLYSVDEPRRAPVFEEATDITETLARTQLSGGGGARGRRRGRGHDDLPRARRRGHQRPASSPACPTAPAPAPAPPTRSCPPP